MAAGCDRTTLHPIASPPYQVSPCQLYTRTTCMSIPKRHTQYHRLTDSEILFRVCPTFFQETTDL